jgi:hypothetical protein
MKRLLLGLAVIAALFFGYHQLNYSSPKQTVKIKTENKKSFNSPFAVRKFPPVVKHNRRPASVNVAVAPKKLEGITIAPNALKIGKSFTVVEGVNAIAKNKYSPAFGKKIKEDKYFVFFAPNATQKGLPVAFNAQRQKLYPISQVLHLRGIDTIERAQFKAEGMSEFYYHAPLKMLSLNTSPGTVIQQYESLKARGFDVKLEVLKETVQAR